LPTPQELINRGNNLFLIGFLGVLGLTGIPEGVGEGGVTGAFDEAGLLLAGVAAAAWYSRNRYARSLVPLAFAGADILIKVAALVIEDPDDRGDDVGTLITLVVLLVTWSVVYLRTRPALRSREVVGQPQHPAV
jgi:peptidoglycan/LPS O-acetylase OafA/YrhL